jgi:hypothetical protein
MRNGVMIHVGLAVNDVVVARGAGAGMAELKVTVDGHFMYNQRSDGLIISTPTGSTAYALSAGGPLLHPSLGGIVLVPIAPHALSNRPIVVPESSEIVIEIVRGRDISVNFDMQTFASLQHGDQIVIRARRTPSPSCIRKAGATTTRCAKSCTGTSIRPVKASSINYSNSGACFFMLRTLSIRDFVIVDTIELEFAAGFSVFTGETGAGKSILIDALQLALGGRGDASVVREGAAKADITADFALSEQARDWLEAE